MGYLSSLSLLDTATLPCMTMRSRGFLSPFSVQSTVAFSAPDLARNKVLMLRVETPAFTVDTIMPQCRIPSPELSAPGG